MKIFRKVQDLNRYLKTLRPAKISFVPTMGALHEGHLSLLSIAKEQSDICVSSIYVNPTQFNEINDLKHYPRTFEKDAVKLINQRTDILFYPTDKEIYPEGFDTKVHVQLNGLDTVMEGEFRPGHFDGMLQVVHRLLKVVEPDYIVMGQKDIQQAQIVNTMLAQLMPDIRLIIGPTIREIDGLAMSSRNKRLTPAIRDRANILFKTLKWASHAVSSMTIDQVEQKALSILSIPDFKPEYFKIVNAETLLPVIRVEKGIKLLACTAVWAGEIRLIDNMFIEKKL